MFKDHTASIYTLSFSPDSRLFATAGADGCLHVYDVKVGLFLERSDTFANTLRHSHKSFAGHGAHLRIDLLSLKLTGSSPRTSIV